MSYQSLNVATLTDAVVGHFLACKRIVILGTPIPVTDEARSAEITHLFLGGEKNQQGELQEKSAIYTINLADIAGERFRSQLLRILTSNTVKVGYDWYSLAMALFKHDLTIDGQLFDVGIALKLIDHQYRENNVTIQDVLTFYNALPRSEPIQIIENGTEDECLDTFADIARALFTVRSALVQEIKEKQLVEIAKIEFDCIPATVQMGVMGTAVDKERLDTYRDELLVQYQAIKDELAGLVGDPEVLENTAATLAYLRENGVDLPNLQRKTLKA